MGMINQFGKFSPNLAELTQPLRELLRKQNSWTWSHAQDQAFTNVKTELTKPTVLTLFNVNAELKSLLMHHHLGLVPSFYKRTASPVSPLLLLPECCLTLSVDTLKSRRKPWQSLGHARNFHHIYWAKLSLLRQTTNCWSHY